MLKHLMNLFEGNDEKLKTKLIEAKYIIGEIILDLEIIIRIQNNYAKRHQDDPGSDERNIAPDMYNRVVHSFLFLTLYKYTEFYKKYCQYFSKVIDDGMPKKIYDELVKLNIKLLRDKYIGHIIDKDTDSPISIETYNGFFDNINKHHKSLYAFYLKLDTYDLLDYPLIALYMLSVFSAAYLCHLGIELLLKGCWLYESGYFEDEHDLIKIKQKIRFLRLSNNMEVALSNLQLFNDMRYPLDLSKINISKSEAQGENMFSNLSGEVGDHDWVFTLELLREIQGQMPEDLRKIAEPIFSNFKNTLEEKNI